MVAQNVEELKRQFTDKYVVVDGEQPELARFRDVVGLVKTVNMSGRALVEFLDYHVNIGWYDIDLSYLKLVDKPEPKSEKPEGKKAAKAPAAVRPGSPQAEAASPAKSKAAKPAAAGKPSVADILAAARGGAAPAGAEVAAAPAKAAPAAKPAAKPAGVDRSKMSVADMLAAARAGGAGTAKAAPADKAPTEEAPAEEEAEAVAAPVAAKPKPAAAAKSSEKIDKSKMSIDDMVTWCQTHDAK